jgi:hypothetical protein
VNLVLTARSPFTDLAVQNPATDFGPFFHVRKHPCLLLILGSKLSQNRKSVQNSAEDHLGATFLFQFTTPRQALRFLAVVYIEMRMRQFTIA